MHDLTGAAATNTCMVEESLPQTFCYRKASGGTATTGKVNTIRLGCAASPLHKLYSGQERTNNVKGT